MDTKPILSTALPKVISNRQGTKKGWKKKRTPRLRNTTVQNALSTGQSLHLTGHLHFNNNVGYVCECCLNTKEQVYIKQKPFCKEHNSHLTGHHTLNIEMVEPKNETKLKEQSPSRDLESTNQAHNPKLTCFEKLPASPTLEVTTNRNTEDPNTPATPCDLMGNSNSNDINFKALTMKPYFITEAGFENYLRLLFNQSIQLLHQGHSTHLIKEISQLDKHNKLFDLAKHQEFCHILGNDYLEFFALLNLNNLLERNLLARFFLPNSKP